MKKSLCVLAVLAAFALGAVVGMVLTLNNAHDYERLAATIQARNVEDMDALLTETSELLARAAESTEKVTQRLEALFAEHVERNGAVDSR